MTYFRTLLIAVALLALPLTASAQSSLAVADAAAFMGAWELGLDTPQGAMTMNLTLKDAGGKVDASISAPPVMPDAQQIADVSRDGANLLLKYTLDVQGMSIPAKILLVPVGDKWKASFDFMDGQFTVEGTATKK